MDTLHQCVLQNISKLDYSETFGSQIENLTQMVSKLIECKESGSATIVGPNPCCKIVKCKISFLFKLPYKTVLFINFVKIVKTALAKFQDAHGGNITVVKLHGGLHTDEKLIYKEIKWFTQVDLDSVDDEDEDDCEQILTPDNIEQILTTLYKRKCKGVVFVLNQFEQFTTSTHQNFLYNILNKVQTCQPKKETPILVLCVTSRINAAELLEKRVRSRLSQRKLLAFPNWNWETYLQIACDCLHLQKYASLRKLESWNSSVKSCLKDKMVIELLENMFEQNKSIESLKQFLALAVNFAAQHKDVKLCPKHFQETNGLLSTDSLQFTLKSLTPLEMDLILATLQYYKQYPDEDYVNFEMIYKEYQIGKKLKSTPKNQIRRTMEKLIDQEIFVAKKSEKQDENLPILNLFDYKLIRLQLDHWSVINFVKSCHDYPQETKLWARDLV